MTRAEFDEALGSLTNTFFSGGADGADRHFTLYAMENGFECVNLSFKNHDHSVPEETILRIPSHILHDSSVLDMLKEANKKLQRRVPKPNTYVYNLLARNRYQVYNIDRLYAMCQIVSPSQVSGGTAWAVQMYIDSVENPEIYVFDVTTKTPHKYDCSTKEFVPCGEIPKPHGNWAGIGSRTATVKDMEYFRVFFV